jgi:hypothetical protein
VFYHDSGMNVYISVSWPNNPNPGSKLALAVTALAYDFYSRFLITAAVNSEVVDEPAR